MTRALRRSGTTAAALAAAAVLDPSTGAVLKTVADAIGMHESTVSRVTSNKSLATSRGIFEMKYFFTAAIPGAAGAAATEPAGDSDAGAGHADAVRGMHQGGGKAVVPIALLTVFDAELHAEIDPEPDEQHLVAGLDLVQQRRGHGGVAAEAQARGLPFLGEIPLDLSVRLGGDEAAPGTELKKDGKKVGWLTTVTRAPGTEAPVALGYVHRDHLEPGTVLTLGDGPAEATVTALPFA